MPFLTSLFVSLVSSAFVAACKATVNKAQKTDLVISTLKEWGLDAEHPAPDFTNLYAHALVEYAVDGSQEFLKLLRDMDVASALRSCWENLDAQGFADKVAELVERLASGDEVKAKGLNTKEEAHKFWRIFQAWSSRSRTVPQVEDRAISTHIKNDVSEIAKVIPDLLITENEIRDLTIAFLLGGWKDDHEGDRLIVEELSGKQYSDWIQSIRKASFMHNPAVTLREKQWVFDRSLDHQAHFSRRIFDNHLEKFSDCITIVLNEKNPMFELPPNSRFMADIHGKRPTFSHHLRKGLAESMAFIGSNPQMFTSCSFNKPENTAYRVVYDLLFDAEGLLWASLNDGILCSLAEASPDAFLKSVRNCLEKSPCPFGDVFAEESGGFGGSTHIASLLWGLEALAWNPDYFMRVILILGDLAAIDPGGNWANRPINSIKDILLPWRPHTLVDKEKRVTALKTLLRDQPEIGWEIALKLLPGQHESTSGTNKPLWRKYVPENYEPVVMQIDYFEETSSIIDLIVSAADGNIHKLITLVDQIPNIWENQRGKILSLLTSDFVFSLIEKDRVPIWEALLKLYSKHSNFSHAEWAMSEDWRKRIEETISKLEPKSPSYLYRRFFTDNSWDLFSYSVPWDKVKIQLERNRKEAIAKIVDEIGKEGLFDFSETVDNAYLVGEAYAKITNLGIDSELLLLQHDIVNVAHSEFLRGYLWARFAIDGWDRISKLKSKEVNTAQMAFVLTCTPFCVDTWNRLSDFDEEVVRQYWLTVKPVRYSEETDFSYTIDKFIDFDRVNEAVMCASMQQMSGNGLPVSLISKILFYVLKKQDDVIDWNTIINLIKELQDNPETPQNELEKIEFSYLRLIGRPYCETYPKSLEKRMATDPEYYCYMISSLYKSDKDDEDIDIDVNQETLNRQLFHLLRGWRTPPGLNSDGAINSDVLNQWIQDVRVRMIESGHWSIAAHHIGQVLFHVPKHESGLWIDKNVAEVLDQRGNETLREGFRENIVRARGGYVFSQGVEEHNISIKFRERANVAEDLGFVRLAETLRQVSMYYADLARMPFGH